jgi:hypothetical protein
LFDLINLLLIKFNSYHSSVFSLALGIHGPLVHVILRSSMRACLQKFRFYQQKRRFFMPPMAALLGDSSSKRSFLQTNYQKEMKILTFDVIRRIWRK